MIAADFMLNTIWSERLELKQFSTDDDYILGALADSEFDEDRKLIIEYIDNGEDVSYESVILFSLEVGQQRDKLLNR